VSEKKIVVPEGMVQAAYNAQLATDPPSFSWNEADELTRRFYSRILEAALRWQNSNGPVPTGEWIKDELKKDSHIPNPEAIVQRIISRWIRGMYDAPEPEYENQPIDANNYFDIPQKLREAAYARIENFDGKIGDGFCTGARIDMILEEAKKFYSPEPEVSEEINVLVNEVCADISNRPEICDRIREGIIEAYRRGQKAGLK